MDMLLTQKYWVIQQETTQKDSLFAKQALDGLWQRP
jgi:hypothetical protein